MELTFSAILGIVGIIAARFFGSSDASEEQSFWGIISVVCIIIVLLLAPNAFMELQQERNAYTVLKQGIPISANSYGFWVLEKGTPAAADSTRKAIEIMHNDIGLYVDTKKWDSAFQVNFNGEW